MLLSNGFYIWLAVDRNRNKVIDVEISEKRDAKSYKELAERIKKNYNVNLLCTDYYSVYQKHSFAKEHLQTKAETSLVESKNSSIRDNLARFNRRTKRFSKVIEMAKLSILMLFNKEMLYTFI